MSRIYRYSQLPNNTDEVFYTNNDEFIGKIRNNILHTLPKI